VLAATAGDPALPSCQRDIPSLSSDQACCRGKAKYSRGPHAGRNRPVSVGIAGYALL